MSGPTGADRRSDAPRQATVARWRGRADHSGRSGRRSAPRRPRRGWAAVAGPSRPGPWPRACSSRWSRAGSRAPERSACEPRPRRRPAAAARRPRSEARGRPAPGRSARAPSRERRRARGSGGRAVGPAAAAAWRPRARAAATAVAPLANRHGVVRVVCHLRPLLRSDHVRRRVKSSTSRPAPTRRRSCERSRGAAPGFFGYPARRDDTVAAGRLADRGAMAEPSRPRRRSTPSASGWPRPASAACRWTALGAVPHRAAVGHGARGLQRRRRRLGLLPARPRPLARLPLERGRPGRHLRRPAAALLRAGALERPRPDPQGAALRPDRPRGQPRRGRQGVLLLPRQRRRRTPT